MPSPTCPEPPPCLLVRPLVGREDAPAFRALRLEALRLHPEAFGASFEEEEATGEAEFAARIPHAPPNAIFGAFWPGQAGAAPALCGMAGLLVQRLAKLRHKGVLWGMYVRPEVRRHGVARSLLQEVIAHARDAAGLEMLQLTVVTENQAARRLYERAGFTTYGIESRALRLGPDRCFDEALMALDLRGGR